MKRFVVLAAVALVVAIGASAKDYQSSFGFSLSAPDSWLVMNKAELASNPVLATADPGVRSKVESGAFEIIYNRATSDATFADNVNLRVGGKGSVPNGADAVKAECTRYGQALAKSAGRTLEIAKCEDRELGTAKAFYIEYEGRVAGTVTIQYQLVRPDGKLVYVTATCKQSSLDKFRPEFDGIVKSIRFN